jgi:hypothetical protein
MYLKVGQHFKTRRFSTNLHTILMRRRLKVFYLCDLCCNKFKQADDSLCSLPTFTKESIRGRNSRLISTKDRWGHFNFMNSRLQLHEFSISTSRIHNFHFMNSWFQLQEFTISTSWIHDFNITNSISWIHDFNFVNSQFQFHEFTIRKFKKLKTGIHGV